MLYTILPFINRTINENSKDKFSRNITIDLKPNDISQISTYVNKVTEVKKDGFNVWPEKTKPLVPTKSPTLYDIGQIIKSTLVPELCSDICTDRLNKDGINIWFTYDDSNGKRQTDQINIIKDSTTPTVQSTVQPTVQSTEETTTVQPTVQSTVQSTVQPTVQSTVQPSADPLGPQI